MEENFANKVTDKGLIFKIYEQLIQHNIKTNKQPKQKMGKRTVNQNYNEVSSYTSQNSHYQKVCKY